MANETQEQALHIADSGRIYSLPSGDYLYAEDVDALRAFFLRERDEQLGRWRWPENADYVVYPDGTSRRVVKESNGTNMSVSLFDRERMETYLDSYVGAALAYDAAHPEPKPWRDATPGEVWSITGPSIDRDAPKGADGGAIALCFEDNSGGHPEPTLYFVFGDGGASDTVEIDDKVITAATRIYPPAEES